MLNKFFEEWNNALKNQEIVRTQTDASGNVIWENTKFQFRGVEIENHKKPNPANINEWMYELYVPSTKKFISSSYFKNRAECAAAILMALIPGNEYEERRFARIAARKSLMTHRIMKERKRRMKKTNFTSEQRMFWMNLFHENFVHNKAKFDDTLMNVLEKFCDVIIGAGMDDRTRERHISVMFENAAMIMSKTFTGNKGDLMISKLSAERMYKELPMSDKMPDWIKTIRIAFHDMDEFVKHPVRFIYCIDKITAFYEWTTAISRDARLAASREKRARARERRLNNDNYVRGGFKLGDIINEALGNEISKTVEKAERKASYEKSKKFEKKQEDTEITSGSDQAKGFGQPFAELLKDFGTDGEEEIIAPPPRKKDTRRKQKRRYNEDDEE